MWLKKKPSELRVVIVLLIIVMTICMAGALLYKSLSSISKTVTTSAQTNTRSSILLRQILIDIREAENNVRSYNLTNNTDHLISFYISIKGLDTKLEELNKTDFPSVREKIIIDSVIILSEIRYEILKSQLFVDDETKITDELNAISDKILETYEGNSKNDERNLLILQQSKDTIQKKERFFKRLFGKKQKNADTIRVSQISPEKIEKKTYEIEGALLNTVEKVKQAQEFKLIERKTLEQKFTKEGKQIVDKIRAFSNELEEAEKQSTAKKINSANSDVNTIKILAIIISSIVSILLIIVSILIVNYIGKKRQYEAALILAKQKAEDLSKTKEAFLANMSHEIKTPLNAIHGFTEQVLKSDLTTKQHEQLTIVKESADHLIQLISDILDYSKIQAGKILIEQVDFDLQQELGNIKTLFTQPCANKNLGLNFMIDVSVPQNINADLTKLKQIMYNLIGNAIKFTDIGAVSVEVKKNDHPSFSSLEIRVTDTGIGIAEKKISKLFNEYEQLHTDLTNKYGGTGLGLVITKKILEHLGGSISIESVENKGTEVTIQFPYSEFSNIKRAEEVPGISEEAFQNVLHGKKILIVDDERFNRLLLKTILLKYDTTLTEATNGNEAVALIKDNIYDIVLMDVRMPEKNGIDACIEIRAFEKTLIILASTAVINKEKTNKCVEAGFNGFVFKPFNEKNLLENLHNHLTGQNIISEASQLDSIETNNKLNFDELFSIANGDEHFKKEMIAIFHKSINIGLKQIEELILEKDWLKIADAAHKVLPSCKHFQANSLYATLKYFENFRDKTPSENELSIKLQQLKQDVSEVNLELQVYL